MDFFKQGGELPPEEKKEPQGFFIPPGESSEVPPEEVKEEEKKEGEGEKGKGDEGKKGRKRLSLKVSRKVLLFGGLLLAVLSAGGAFLMIFSDDIFGKKKARRPLSSYIKKPTAPPQGLSPRKPPPASSLPSSAEKPPSPSPTSPSSFPPSKELGGTPRPSLSKEPKVDLFKGEDYTIVKLENEIKKLELLLKKKELESKLAKFERRGEEEVKRRIEELERELVSLKRSASRKRATEVFVKPMDVKVLGIFCEEDIDVRNCVVEVEYRGNTFALRKGSSLYGLKVVDVGRDYVAFSDGRRIFYRKVEYFESAEPKVVRRPSGSFGARNLMNRLGVPQGGRMR